MSLPQTPPRGGNNRRPVHFAYTPTDKGSNWTGYLAGPAMWFACHPSFKTKPCVEEVPGCELKCQFCAAGQLAVVKGWVPLYRQVDHKPCCVIVNEDARGELAKLPHLSRVIVSRVRGKGNPTAVTRALDQEPAYRSTLPERAVPADMTDTLLRLWAMPELTHWYQHTHGVSDNPVSQPRPADQGQMLREHVANIRDGKPSTLAQFGGALLGDDLGEVIERAKHRSSNGKPRRSDHGGE